MKTFVVSAFILCTFTVSLIAQNYQESPVKKNSSKQSSLGQLLFQYYDIKDALVNSNPVSADSSAEDLVKAIQKIDMKSLTESEHTAFMSLQNKLTTEAKNISQSKDLSKQRINFASLSDDLYSLAKKVKLTTQPIYRDYCPMKKKYWLSSESSIKNPYYGKAMPTCGTIEETLK